MSDVFEISGGLNDAVYEDGDLSAGGALKVENATGGAFLAYQLTGEYGSFNLLSNGSWTYELNNALGTVQSLGAGQSTVDRFLVSWYGSNAEQANNFVTVTIQGRNDLAQVSGDTAVSLYGATQSGVSGVLSIDDVDAGQKAFVASSGSGAYGNFSIDARGDWGYQLRSGVSLPTQAVDDVFLVQTADGTASSVKVSVSNAALSTSPSNGSDRLAGTAGNDAIDGLAGVDTLVLSGARRAYSLTPAGGGFQLVGSEGSDSLSHIERLQFADKKLALDISATGNAGQAIEFIGTIAFGMLQAPNVVGGIMAFFDKGTSMHELFQLAVDIHLIDDLAGSSSNLDLARLVYRNVIGSEAPSDVAQALAGYLQGSGGAMSKADFLTLIAETELNQVHVNLVGLAQTGIEFA